MIRRLKADVLKDLPPKRRSRITVPPDKHCLQVSRAAVCFIFGSCPETDDLKCVPLSTTMTITARLACLTICCPQAASPVPAA